MNFWSFEELFGLNDNIDDETGLEIVGDAEFREISSERIYE